MFIRLIFWKQKQMRDLSNKIIFFLWKCIRDINKGLIDYSNFQVHKQLSAWQFLNLRYIAPVLWYSEELDKSLNKGS